MSAPSSAAPCSTLTSEVSNSILQTSDIQQTSRTETIKQHEYSYSPLRNQITEAVKSLKDNSEEEALHSRLRNQISEAIQGLEDKSDEFNHEWADVPGLDYKIYKAFQVVPRQASQQSTGHPPAEESSSGQTPIGNTFTHTATTNGAPSYGIHPHGTPSHYTPVHPSYQNGTSSYGQSSYGQSSLRTSSFGSNLYVPQQTGTISTSGGQHTHNMYHIHGPQTNQHFQDFQNPPQMSWGPNAQIQTPQVHQPYQGSGAVQGNGSQLPVGFSYTPQQQGSFQHGGGGYQPHLTGHAQLSRAHQANNPPQIY